MTMTRVRNVGPFGTSTRRTKRVTVSAGRSKSGRESLSLPSSPDDQSIPPATGRGGSQERPTFSHTLEFSRLYDVILLAAKNDEPDNLYYEFKTQVEKACFDDGLIRLEEYASLIKHLDVTFWEGYDDEDDITECFG